MELDDLITRTLPPAKRAGMHTGTHEEHFHEGAVMLALAMHLLDTQSAGSVRMHPDGEHGKRTDFARWLSKRGFEKVSRLGSTSYGGTYRDQRGREVTIHPKSGLRDVVADIGGIAFSAECKGGIINTRHPGQRSRLDRGLCEAVGRLMIGPSGGRQLAVVPRTDVTIALAKKMAPRCAAVGIEIALIGSRGELTII